jgi:hypothetical protein
MASSSKLATLGTKTPSQKRSRCGGLESCTDWKTGGHSQSVVLLIAMPCTKSEWRKSVAGGSTYAGICWPQTQAAEHAILQRPDLHCSLQESAMAKHLLGRHSTMLHSDLVLDGLAEWFVLLPIGFLAGRRTVRCVLALLAVLHFALSCAARVAAGLTLQSARSQHPCEAMQPHDAEPIPCNRARNDCAMQHGVTLLGSVLLATCCLYILLGVLSTGLAPSLVPV